MRFFIDGKLLRPTMVHGDRGEKRILTNILQALVHSEHEVITNLPRWLGPDPKPKGLELGKDQYTEKYDAAIGWNINANIYTDNGKTKARYNPTFPTGVPIISYYSNGMDSLNYIAPKLKARNPLIVPVNTFHLDKQHASSTSLPVPMAESISPSHNFDSRDFMFTLRSGFTDGNYKDKNIQLVQALLNRPWGAGPDGHVYILEGLPQHMGSSYVRRLGRQLSQFAPALDNGRLVILTCQMYEQVLRRLSECKMSFAIHPISGSKIQSAMSGCLPALFDKGWWDKGAGWQALQDTRGRHKWTENWDDVKLSGAQLVEKVGDSGKVTEGTWPLLIRL